MASNICPEFDVSNLVLDFPENSSALIKSVWSKSSFSINLFDGLNTWTGEMNSDTIAILSEQLGLSMQEYIEECRSAFSAKGKDKGFVFMLRYKDDTFQWKKESLDMRITFGQIRLEKTPVVCTLHSIINEMLNENSHLKEKLSIIQKEKIHLMTENKHLIEALEDCNNLKCEMENDLFKQFLKVLNTKKEKIKELKKHTHLKSQYETTESDNLSKYECDTEIDSDSDEEDEEDNVGSVPDPKEKSSKISDVGSDSDEQSDKCLLPKRNRLATSKRTFPNRQAETEKLTSLPSDKCKAIKETQSNFTEIQAVPSTSSCLPKKVNQSVAVSFVDSDEELEENITAFSSDRKTMLSPEQNQETSSSVMHSPKKHGRFRYQLVEDETSILSTDNGPSTKVPKIENKCVSDESDSSIRFSENNQHQKMNETSEICLKKSGSDCSENNCKQTKVTVKDLIDGLFS